MAEESSDQKAVFTSIKDSFFDDPFFKVRKRIIKWQFYYNIFYILYVFLLKKIKTACTMSFYNLLANVLSGTGKVLTSTFWIKMTTCLLKYYI